MHVAHFERTDDKLFENLEFIKETFSDREISYCKSRKSPKMHFAGIYCAKKSIEKCLCKKIDLKTIEITHEKSGKPVACINSLKFNGDVSITHTNSLAGAYAVSEEKQSYH